MSKAEKLTQEEIEQALSSLQGWSKVKDHDLIAKKFKFKDFNEAFGFMTRVALIAERMDHHPEWSNVYNKIDVALTTHSAKGITSLDIMLASAMDKLAQT